jgi:predicted dehydrogenase
MDLCIIGSRGHQGYVADGIENIPDINITGISTGTDEDNPVDLEKMFDLKELKGFNSYTDWRLMFKTLQPDIVSIAGPFEKRAEMCLEAFRNHIHVFCEKPVALTIQELEKMKKAHKESQVHFAHMMGTRYQPSFYTAWQSVKNGVIGEIRLINAQKSYKLGSRPAYYHRRDTYGGTIPWVGSHAIDWIHWFTGKTFNTVYASHSIKNNQGHGELESTALCHFTLQDDVYASVTIDYLRPPTAKTHGDDRIRIVGTKGILEVRHDESTIINNETRSREKLDAKCDKQIFHDFVEHVKGNSNALIQAADTFNVTEACLLARQSADENRIKIFHGNSFDA